MVWQGGQVGLGLNGNSLGLPKGIHLVNHHPVDAQQLLDIIHRVLQNILQAIGLVQA
jgi:hypothetical protein